MAPSICGRDVRRGRTCHGQHPLAVSVKAAFPRSPKGERGELGCSVAQAETARTKMAEWLRRYGIAECVGVSCALLGSFAARRITGSAIAAAYSAAWGESIGYSSFIVARDFLTAARAARSAGHTLTRREGGGVITRLLAEFGPAGILDTFVTRPFAMGVGARFFGPQRGIIAGKLAADALFYIPVIFMHERLKRKQAGRR